MLRLSAFFARLAHLLVLLALFLSWSAQATIVGGTIDFGTGHSLNQDIGTLNGLTFPSGSSADGWSYATDLTAPNKNGDGAYATNGYGSTPAIITAATPGDLFSVTSIKIANWGTNSNMTVKGYLSGSQVATQTLTLTSDNTFHTYSLNISGVDQITFSADQDFSYAIDDLVVAAYVTSAPTATTSSATNIGYASATLNGTVSSNNAATTVTFKYGTTASYGTTVTAAESPLSATASNTSVSAGLTGLSCNTTYHYQVDTVNSIGTTTGSDATFTTKACVPDAPTAVTATAGDGQASVSFTAPSYTGASSITGYTVSDGTHTGTGSSSPITVTGLTNGTSYTFTVVATNSYGNSVGTTATAVTPQGAQTITFNNPGAQSFGAVLDLTSYVTVSSGLTPSYTSSTTSICTVSSGGQANFISAGTCTISVAQAGNASYSAAPTVSQSFAVNATVPGAPTGVSATAGDTQAVVSFSPPGSNGGASITSYQVTSSGGQTVSGSASPLTVTGLTNGTSYTFTVTATNSAGTGPASAASSAVTAKGSQSITFTNPGTQSFGTTPTLTASAPGGTVTFTSSTAGVCTISSGGTLTFVAIGTCTINADQAGNGTYLAAPTVTQNFSVVGAIPGAPTGISATAGDTQATVTFTPPSSTGGTSITGYTVTSSPAGGTDSNAGSTGLSHVMTGLTNGTSYTFTVTATNSTGTSIASAASNAVTPKGAQTITFWPVPTQNFRSTPTLSATASSGLTVSFTSSTTSVCSITSAGVLTFLSTGTCSINANQAGNTTWAAASTVTQSFAVNATTPNAPTIGTASAGNNQATVTFTAPTDTGGATITTYTVTSNPGNITATGASSPITVTGLTNGTAYTFTVTAANSAGVGPASAASNSVTPAPTPPVAGAVTATVAYASSANVITPVLSSGTATSLAVATQPTHGTASVSGLTLIYTPAASYSGTDTFTYKAVNSGGSSAAATVTVTVTPQAPTAAAVNMTVEINSVNNNVPLALSGGAATSVAVATAPSHGTTTVSGPHLTYTPARDFMGTDTFTYTATNAGGTSAAATVTILVNSRPDPTKDQEVTGLLNAQATTAKQFVETQIGNFQHHLERLHHHKRQEDPVVTVQNSLPGSTKPSDDDTPSSPNSASMPTSPSRTSGRSHTAGNSSTTSNIPANSLWPSNVAGSQGIDQFPQQFNTRNGANTPSLPWSSLNLASDSKDVLGTGIGVWSAGVINLGHLAGIDTRFTTSGLSFGADLPLKDNLTVGVGMGLGHERTKVGDNGTRDTGDNYVFTVYGSYQPSDEFFLDGVLGYSHLNFDAQRYSSSADTVAKSNRTGTQWFASLTGGYEYVRGKLLFSSYTRLDIVRTRLDATTESNAGIYNLYYHAQDISTNKLSLGLRAEGNLKIANLTAKPNIRFEYQHDFEKPGFALMNYADQRSGTVYQLPLDGFNRNAYVLGLGTDLFRKSWAFGLNYQFSHGSGSSNVQTLGFNIKKSF